MTTYIGTCIQSGNDIPGMMEFKAENDEDAIAEITKLVREGYRNQTWAGVLLQDGRTYVSRNEHGAALGDYA